VNELTIERYQSKRKKPGPTAKYRAKRKRAEAPVAKFVRAQCVDRDGDCRVCDWENNPDDYHADDLEFVDDLTFPNPSEWAHLGEKTRAKTRGMKPEARHTTEDSVIFCKVHHDRYDGRQKPRMFVKSLTALGANGPLEFTQ